MVNKKQDFKNLSLKQLEEQIRWKTLKIDNLKN